MLWGRDWLQVNEKKEVNLEIEKERGGWEGVRLKLDVQSQGSGRILDVAGQGRGGGGGGGGGILKIAQFSWTSYVYRP